jgi:hypothetical protein
VLLNILFVAVAYFGRSLGPTYLLLLILTIAFSGLGILFYYKRAKPRMFIAKHLNDQSEFGSAPTPKVVTLTKEAAVVEQQ